MKTALFPFYRGPAWALLPLLLAACGGADDSRDQRMTLPGPNPDLSALMKVADPKMGARKFTQCAGCHHIRPNAPDIGGPNLYNIYNQPLATNSTRFGYTAGLRDFGGRWDAATLDRWMKDPKAMIPATTMQITGVTHPLDRADIIAYIQSQSK
jgi:cytochrome c